MRQKVFKWDDRIPVNLMRIEPGRKLYAYDHQKGDEMVFTVIPKGGYRGSINMLRARLARHHWSQARAAEVLEVSQPTIAKYLVGKRILQHRVVFGMQDLNGDKALDKSWRKYDLRKPIFKLTNGTHILLMRIEALGKLFAYENHKGDEMVFKVVKVRRHEKGDDALKALRAKRGWTQAEAGKLLGVSQSAIAKYEKGHRITKGRLANTVRLLNDGLTMDEIKEMRKQLERLRKGG